VTGSQGTTAREGAASGRDSSRGTTVAVVAIGNELLSGKVTDLNLAYMVQELRKLGVPLVHAAIVPDEPRAIADAVSYALARASLVLTTGGIGPTHDDVTVSSIALALGRKLVRNAPLEQAIRSWYGTHVNDEVLRMADVPEGAELLADPHFFLPLLKVDRVVVFPGEPAHMKRQFDNWKSRLAEEPFVLARIFLDVDEGEIARDLREVEAAHQVAIGSYPKYDRDAADAGYRVLITIESKNRVAVEAATRDLLGRLRPGRLIRTETARS
jgi:molybdenum cofactor synthesis domain-containing protein